MDLCVFSNQKMVSSIYSTFSTSMSYLKKKGIKKIAYRFYKSNRFQKRFFPKTKRSFFKTINNPSYNLQNPGN